MSSLGNYVKNMVIEVPLCLYMLSSFLKLPVFQNLIYEKECLLRYDQNLKFCANVSAYFDDKNIQSDANYFYFLSSLVLTIPSLITTLLLGAASDYWSLKIPLVIPYIGLLLGSINDIVQSHWIHLDVHYLLISDALFGTCGGYIAIISTSLTYGVKMSLIRHRSYRIAGIEGAIGLGGTIGYALSGTVREALGYANTFMLILALQVIALTYILVLAKECKYDELEPTENTNLISVTGRRLWTVIVEFYQVLTKKRRFRLLLSLNLIAFGIELLIFSGLSDIQYSYLRYKLQWGDKKYGWFSGLTYGMTTAAVLLIYPLLRHKFFTDGVLGCLGLLSKIASLLMFAFVQNEAMAFSISVVMMLNRFVSTGFRAFISSLLEHHEQGKIFSVISLVEGITALVATSTFNNLYPKTLNFFPGLLYLVSAVLLLVPLVILGLSDRTAQSESTIAYSEDVIESQEE